MLKETTGTTIKYLRKKHNLTREGLCQMIRLGGNSRAEDVQRLYKAEQDKFDLSDSVIKTLASLFGVSVDDIKGESYKYNEELFPEKLKVLLYKNDLSRTELAEEIGVNRATISNYVNDNHNPSQENLKKILNYFDLSIEYFQGGEVEEIENPIINDENWITIEEAAELLNCSKSTIYNRYRNGELSRKRAHSETGHQIYLYKKDNLLELREGYNEEIVEEKEENDKIKKLMKEIKRLEKRLEENEVKIETFNENIGSFKDMFEGFMQQQNKGFFKRLFN